MEAAIKVSELGRSIRATFRAFGAVYIVGGIGAAWLVRGPALWWTTPVKVLAGGCVGMGLYMFWKTRGRHPLPRWMYDPDKARNRVDVVARWPLEIMRKVIRMSWVRSFLEGASSAKPFAVSPSVPTAMLLLNRVGDLLHDLPRHVVERLGPVREIAESLERAVAQLRQRGVRLAAAAAEVAPGCAAHAEFLAELALVQRRIKDGTAELDRLRTNLLRLGAGLTFAEGITGDIERLTR